MEIYLPQKDRKAASRLTKMGKTEMAYRYMAVLRTLAWEKKGVSLAQRGLGWLSLIG